MPLCPTPPLPATWLITGASGRVGRLIGAHWAMRPPAAARILRQTREASLGALVWDPLREGPGALLALAARQGPPAALIHLAGPTGRDADPALAPALAEAVLAAAVMAGVGRVLLASSAAVYGGARALPYAETDPSAPITAYGAGKCAAETVAARWRDRGLSVCALRIGNVAGADALLTNPSRPLVIDRFGDAGEAAKAGPERSYIGPATLAAVLETLATCPALPAVLNVAAPAPIGMAALAEAAGLPWAFAPAPVGAQHRIVLECTRLAALHDFAPGAARPETMIAELAALNALPPASLLLKACR